MTPFVALSIAGSDSGGGAGLQADLKTFAAHRVHGVCAITAVTAQNTARVTGVEVLASDFVLAQVRAVLDDFDVRAVKTGMLATAAMVATVAQLAKAGELSNLVVDPVLVSTSGHALMDADGVDAYRTLLLPHASVATPNLRETAVLTGIDLSELTSIDAMIEAAAKLHSLGTRVVVVKGGHFEGSPETGSPDVVCSAAGIEVLHADRIDTANDHGTGCSLSAAIAANLASGLEPLPAIRAAKEFVRRALIGGVHWQLGKGHGPIDHFGWSTP